MSYIFSNVKLTLPKNFKISVQDDNINFYVKRNFESKIKLFNNEKLIIIIIGKVKKYKNKKFQFNEFVENFEKLNLGLLKKYISNLKGDFNLIIYEKLKNKLFFARDIEGLLPLYYKITGNFFFISDTPKNLIFNNSKIDIKFCKSYIFSRYNFVYGKKDTFIKQIKFVEAASYVEFSKNKIVNKRYWDGSLLKINHKIDYEKAKKKTITLLKKKFKKSDIKKNILALSGGLDSASVAAIFKLNKQPLDSFTAFYNSKDVIDESIPAMKIASKCCKSWQKVRITSLDFFNNWKNCYDNFTFPVCTSSFIGYLILYKRIRKRGYSKIVNGGNGDHFFLGNFPVFKYYLADLLFSKNKKFETELDLWIKNFSTTEFPKNKKIFFKFLKSEKLNKKNDLFSFFIKNEVVGQDYLKNKITQNKVKFKGSSFVDIYLKHSLWYGERQPGILCFSEIEDITNVRSVDPFDNIDLRNFFYSLKNSFKIKNGYGKRIIRDVLKNILPKSIIDNKSKIGFNVPFSEWMFSDKKIFMFILKNLRIFSNYRFSNFIEMKSLIKDFSNKNQKLKTTNNTMFIWQITNFTMWYEQNKKLLIDEI